MIKTLLSLLVPFGVWIGVYHPFFTGHLLLGNAECTIFVRWADYYIANLARGVFPLWNPFHAWGSVDNFSLINIGTLNPTHLLMALLIFCGWKVYWAFFIVLALYFWVGCLGFYVLARQVIGGKKWSYLAYIFLLFSTVGVNVFTYITPVYLFVSTVWFFVFLIAFIRSERFIDRLLHALGITFTLMITVSTYEPFYFILILFFLFLVCLIFARQWFYLFFKAFKTFVCEAPVVVLLCLLSVILYCAPSAIWYHEFNSGQVVQKNEQRDPSDKKDLGTTLDTINMGSLASWDSWEELFSDFNSGGFSNDSSYVSVLIFIFFGLSFFNRTRRHKVVIFVTALLLFLFALGEPTRGYLFLYKHFYFLHLFRNYWLFGPFIVALLILFLVGELKEFISFRSAETRDRILRVIYIALIHVLFFSFLWHLDNVPVTSFVTVVLSGIWFIAWQLGLFSFNEKILVAGLAMIAILQPMQVLPYTDSQGGVPPYQYDVNKPVFAYMRPAMGSGYNEEFGLYTQKLCKDESGFVKSEYTGTRFSYNLYSHVPHESLKEYVQYKFILYDRTAFMDNENPDWGMLKDHLASLENEALVGDQSAVKEMDGAPAKAQALRGPRTELKVLAYDLNSIRIKTNFPVRKFMVYNDSYYPGWQAFIDGKKAPLYQANMAFKGMWIEAGEHTIDMNFSSGRYLFFVFLILFITAWLIALLVLYNKKAKFYVR